MQINRFIIEVLNERKLSIQDLYTILRHSLPKDSLPISYSTFKTQLDQNNLSAIELIQVASVLDLNLNELVEIQKFFLNKNTPALNTRLEQRLEAIFKLTTHRREEKYPYYITEIGHDLYHFMSLGYSESGEPRILIEEFDFHEEMVAVVGNSQYCRGIIPDDALKDPDFYNHTHYEALKKETSKFYTLMPVERKFSHLTKGKFFNQDNDLELFNFNKFEGSKG